MDIGAHIPSTSFTATNGLTTDFQTFLGKWVVIYFYPKDSTSGCTKEGEAFRDTFAQFQELNTVIFGVSRDSLKSHENFKAKYHFPFELISDTDETLCQQFDVIKMKSMYGRQVRGIERSTFLINPKGVVSHIWRKVKVNHHVEDILLSLKNIQLAK